MQLVDDAGTGAVTCKELEPQKMQVTGAQLARRILELLALHPQGLHAAALAKELKEHEQKVYYHVRRLRKAGMLVVERTEEGRGGAAKVLVLTADAFAVRLRGFQELARTATYLPEQTAYLAPFIQEGKLNCKVVVGSPDPHGPEQARSRDANYAIDLALFLGTFLRVRAQPAVVLDTELRDWNQNLIVIGGPVVNKVAERINPKSPAPYDREAKAFLYQGRAFAHDEDGVIVKMPSPYARGKWILHISGKRHSGTRAAILALLTSFARVCAQQPVGNSTVSVVEGIDADSDGIVDAVKFLT